MACCRPAYMSAGVTRWASDKEGGPKKGAGSGPIGNTPPVEFEAMYDNHQEPPAMGAGLT